MHCEILTGTYHSEYCTSSLFQHLSTRVLSLRPLDQALIFTIMIWITSDQYIQNVIATEKEERSMIFKYVFGLLVPLVILEEINVGVETGLY